MARRWPKVFPALSSVVLIEWLAIWQLLPAALMLGFAGPIAALVMSATGGNTEGVQDLVSLAAALVFGALTFTMLGFSSLSSEVISGRLAFFLARPISARTLWLGKLFARFSMALASTLTVLIPTSVFGGEPLSTLELAYEAPKLRWAVVHLPWQEWDMTGMVDFFGFRDQIFEPSVWLILPLGALAIFCVGHVLSFALKVRGPWTVFDLAVGSLATMALVSTLSTFMQLGAIRGFLIAALLPVAVVIVLGSMSGWLQIRWGGISKSRSHGVLSLLLWGGLALCTLGMNHKAQGLLTQDLESYGQILDVVPARQGHWAVMTGLDGLTGGAMTFLVDTSSSTRKRLGSRTSFSNRPFFSDDGQRLFFWQCGPVLDRESVGTEHCHLFVIDLDSGDLRPKTIPLGHVLGGAYRWDVSVDGSKIAIWSGDEVTLLHVDGRILWRRRIPKEDRTYNDGRVHFAKSGEVTVFRGGQEIDSSGRFIRAVLEVWSLSAAQVPELRSVLPWSHGGDWRNLDDDLLSMTHGHEWQVMDFDGQRLHHVSESPALVSHVLSTNQLVLLRPRMGWHASRLESFNPPVDPEGESLQVGRHSISGWIFTGTEPKPGHLLITAVSREPWLDRAWRWPFQAVPRKRQTLVLDASTAEISQAVQGLAAMPLRRRPGELAADWLLDYNGFPYRYHLEHGTLEPVLHR